MKNSEHELQTILFNKKYYNNEKALRWLIKHGYIHNKLDDEYSKNFIRARQVPPKPNSNYVSKKISKNIIFVYQYI